MKIERLQIRNVKGVRYVDVHARPVVNELAGKNGAGKSSILDSIIFALAGKRAIDKEPLRRGADGGEITLQTKDLTIFRRFRPDGGTTLTITAQDGGKYGQGDLDHILGGFTFDPLSFSRLRPQDQVGIIKGLLPEALRKKLHDLQVDLKKVEDDRLYAGRAFRDLGGEPDQVEQIEPVEIESLLSERRAIEAHNREQERIMETRRRTADEVNRARREVEELEAKLAAARDRLDDLDLALEMAPEPAALKDYQDVDDRLSRSEDINRRAAAWRNYQARLTEWRKRQESHANLGEEVKRLRDEIGGLVNSSSPVAGLQFSDDGVVFNGLPFDQLSSAEKLRVSAALGMAVNPKLKIMMIKDGSLLDQDSFRLLADMAQEKGYQLWIETVGKGHDKDALVIEDGELVTAGKAA